MGVRDPRIGKYIRVVGFVSLDRFLGVDVGPIFCARIRALRLFEQLQTSAVISIRRVRFRRVF